MHELAALAGDQTRPHACPFKRRRVAARVSRCARTALAEKRLWVCILPKGHVGQCYATRCDVERVFWEDWCDEESETEQEYLVRTYGPAVAEVTRTYEPKPRPPREKPLPAVVGRARRPVWRDNVFGGLQDGVKTCVSWSGRKVKEHPTLDQYDGRRLPWP